MPRLAVTTLSGILAAGCGTASDRATPVSPPPAAWRDPSPHTITRIAVAPGVELEVLDWGGSGEPLVFLAGLGNTAHVFDDFAPRFGDRFRVIGITRRGFGASSQPAAGYDVESRVADDVAVLDSLRLGKVSLVGHSVAGDELTGLAARYPVRVDRLIYLDAAYDRTVPNTAKRPPMLPMTAADSATPAAVLAYASKLGQPLPEADLRATNVFGPDGRLEREVTPGTIVGAIMKGFEPPPYRRVRAEALAFYAGWESPEGALSPAWWAGLDSAGRRTALESLQVMAAAGRRERDRFVAGVRHGTVVVLPNANHYVWLTDLDDVTTRMREFLYRPRRAP